jgi:hypothetical protein
VIEQRRNKRFEMELPVEIIRTGSDQVSATGTTRNISSGGILFVAEQPMEVDSPVEYVITLASSIHGFVNLRCMGKVLRLERFHSEESEAPSVFVAVSLERYEFQRCKNNKNHSHAEVA